MAIYPGAVFKPTSFGGKEARNRQGRGILHVAVSSRRSYPPNSGNTWHFYVATDGYCEQYVDTDFRAYASAAANDDAISIETAGGLGSSKELNKEPWTPAQVARLADLMRWEAGQPGGAPLELLPDARPGRRGWGPHRLGIKHSGGPRPGWWQPGSELWSSALGKECPGDAKVAQVPNIIELARSGQTQEDDVSWNDKIPYDVSRITGGPQSAAAVIADVFAKGYSNEALLKTLVGQQGVMQASIDRLIKLAADNNVSFDRAAFRQELDEALAKATIDVEVSVRDDVPAS